MTVIEDSNAGQVEVALPVYAAVKLAHEDGIKVMLTGQGADELFGGYSWYAKVVEKEGYKMLRRHMIEDLLLLYKETLEREDKITMAHSIELREPFLDPEVIKVALATSLRSMLRAEVIILASTYIESLQRPSVYLRISPTGSRRRHAARLGNAWDVRRYCKETWI